MSKQGGAKVLVAAALALLLGWGASEFLRADPHLSLDDGTARALAKATNAQLTAVDARSKEVSQQEAGRSPEVIEGDNRPLVESMLPIGRLANALEGKATVTVSVTTLMSAGMSESVAADVAEGATAYLNSYDKLRQMQLDPQYKFPENLDHLKHGPDILLSVLPEFARLVHEGNVSVKAAPAKVPRSGGNIVTGFYSDGVRYEVKGRIWDVDITVKSAAIDQGIWSEYLKWRTLKAVKGKIPSVEQGNESPK